MQFLTVERDLILHELSCWVETLTQYFFGAQLCLDWIVLQCAIFHPVCLLGNEITIELILDIVW